MIRFKILTKYVYIFLAVIIIYNSFGYLMLYFPASSIIKAVVGKSLKEKKIKPEDLSVLAFSIDDLKNNRYDFTWKKPKKEFMFNGKMYDIEDKRMSNDTIYYTVYYDHKESIVEQLFSIHFANGKKDGNTNITSRLILPGLFSENIKNDYAKVYNEELKNIPLLKKEACPQTPFEEIPTPPPRLLV